MDLYRIDWTAVAIVIATFSAPFAAVFAQRRIDERRQAQGRQLAVFRALMSTRATPLDQSQVNAVNAVPLEFAGDAPALKNIRLAWKVYLHHLGQDTQWNDWNRKRQELFSDMVRKIGAHLGYSFDPVEFATEFYAPKAHFEVLSDQDVIRAGIAALFKGTPLPLAVQSMPVDEEMKKLLVSVLTNANAFLDDRSRGASTAPAS